MEKLYELYGEQLVYAEGGEMETLEDLEAAIRESLQSHVGEPITHEALYHIEKRVNILLRTALHRGIIDEMPPVYINRTNMNDFSIWIGDKDEESEDTATTSQECKQVTCSNRGDFNFKSPIPKLPD
jgi:hypothetical protein